jgi:SAM-dependent methyltransferase
MPQSPEVWQWVIDRIDVNFGPFFESIRRDAPVLDIPCGVGYLEHYLLRRGFGNVSAVDLSEEQLAIARAKLAEHGLDAAGRVAFELADVFDYLRRGRTFAAIALIDLLDHLSKERVLELLDLCHASLDHDGLIMIRVTNADNPAFGHAFYRDFTHETAFAPDGLRQCLALTGFEAVKIDYERIPVLGPWPGASMRAAIRDAGLRVLGKFLGVPPGAFSEDLVAVARKI